MRNEMLIQFRASPKQPRGATRVSLNPPKISRNLPKSFHKPFQNRSQSPLGEPLGQLLEHNLDFECPRNDQEAAQNVQERPQTVPNPSQRRPKTFPKPMYKRFFGLYFPTPTLHRFLIDVRSIFRDFWKPRTIHFIDFSMGKRYFLQNRRFCSEVEILEKYEKHQKKTH